MATSAKDLRGQTPDQLRDRLANLKKESFNLRFQQATGKLENTARMRAARREAADLPCEVEVDSFDQLDEVLGLDVELVLLDNFSPEQCVEAVRRRDAAAPATGLECSGGLTLERARAYGASGVDFLSVGALTHSVPALDLGLDLRT